MIRGGGWNNKPQNVRSANRNRNTSENRNNNLGFRVASTLLWEGGVTVIDLERMEKARVIEVGGRGPRGIGITPDGKRLLVANEGDNTIAVYDTGSGKRTETIKTEPHGERPRGIKRWPDGRYYAVALEFSAIALGCGHRRSIGQSDMTARDISSPDRCRLHR